MKIGIVTSVSLDHATPAAIYAKAPSRGQMYDIAVQLAARTSTTSAGAASSRAGARRTRDRMPGMSPGRPATRS